MAKYEVGSHTFLGREDYPNHSNFNYRISLNRSTENTLRLWNGIEKGLDKYEEWETTRNPIKRWFIGWFMGFNKKK